MAQFTLQAQPKRVESSQKRRAGAGAGVGAGRELKTAKECLLRELINGQGDCLSSFNICKNNRPLERENQSAKGTKTSNALPSPGQRGAAGDREPPTLGVGQQSAASSLATVALPPPGCWQPPGTPSRSLGIAYHY